MAIPEDTFTNTVAGAAAYEAYRSGGGRRSYSDECDYYGYDGSCDPDYAQKFLDPMVERAITEIQNLEDQISKAGQDPHPWTRERYWLSIFNEEGEDALQEELEEWFRDEAEEEAQEEAREEAYNQP